jgi:hypothetical protein
MTPAKQTEGERALKIRVDAVITEVELQVDSSYSNLKNNWKQDYLKLPSGIQCCSSEQKPCYRHCNTKCALTQNKAKEDMMCSAVQASNVLSKKKKIQAKLEEHR